MSVIELDEDLLSDLMHGCDCADQGYEVVEQTSWTDQYKLATCELIVRELESGKCYSFDVARHGAYFQGYEYEYEMKGEEVEQKEITVKQWVRVKK